MAHFTGCSCIWFEGPSTDVSTVLPSSQFFHILCLWLHIIVLSAFGPCCALHNYSLLWFLASKTQQFWGFAHGEWQVCTIPALISKLQLLLVALGELCSLASVFIFHTKTMVPSLSFCFAGSKGAAAMRIALWTKHPLSQL